MRVLIVGDVHFDYKHLDATIKAFKELVRVSCDCDKIVFLGDIYHKRDMIHTEVLKASLYWFRHLKTVTKCEIIIVTGNHDYYDYTQDTVLCELLGKYVTLITKPTIYLEMLFLPWLTTEADLARLYQDSYDYIFGHLEITGDCDHFSGVHNKYLKYLDKPTYLGHIHQEKQINSNVKYIGSLIRRTFAEENHKPHCIVLSTETGQEAKIDMPSPTFKTIKAGDTKPDADYYRVVGNDIDKRKYRDAETIKNEPNVNTNISIDIIKAKEEDIVREYLKAKEDLELLTFFNNLFSAGG